MGCSKDAMFLLRLYIKFKIKLLKTLDYILEYIYSFRSLSFAVKNPSAFNNTKINPGYRLILD